MQFEVQNKRFAVVQRCRSCLLAWFGFQFDQLLTERKHELLSNARGTVVEIGPGTGNNLRYLVSGVDWIGIEPNRFMHKHLLTALDRTGIRGRIVNGCAESIPVPTGSVDVVISTLVLCSVSDPAQSLAEIRRILKPEGYFVFIEHTAGQFGSWLLRLQRLVRPLWAIIGDGCCPDREIDVMIKCAGFKITTCDMFTLKGASFLTPYHIAGQAIKTAFTMKENQTKEECVILARETCEKDNCRGFA